MILHFYITVLMTTDLDLAKLSCMWLLDADDDRQP